MVLILVRHAERLDYLEKLEWVNVAERPWDTPLSPKGHQQADAAGNAIQELLEKLGYGNKIHRMYSSPLLRCVETCRGIAKGRYDSKVRVDNRLVEHICDYWYRSWAMQGVSDSTWGLKLEEIPDVTKVELRSEAKLPAVELLRSPEELSLMFGNIDLEHQGTYFPAYTVFEPESDSLAERIGEFAKLCHKMHPEENVVLVSHGGPTNAMYRHLTGEKPSRVGFSSISIVVEEKGKFIPKVTNYVDHLNQGDDLGFAATHLN